MRRSDSEFKQEVYRRYKHYKKSRRNLIMLAAAPLLACVMIVCGLIFLPKLGFIFNDPPIAEQPDGTTLGYIDETQTPDKLIELDPSNPFYSAWETLKGTSVNRINLSTLPTPDDTFARAYTDDESIAKIIDRLGKAMQTAGSEYDPTFGDKFSSYTFAIEIRGSLKSATEGEDHPIGDTSHTFEFVGNYLREGDNGSWYEIDEAAAEALLAAAFGDRTIPTLPLLEQDNPFYEDWQTILTSDQYSFNFYDSLEVNGSPVRSFTDPQSINRFTTLLGELLQTAGNECDLDLSSDADGHAVELLSTREAQAPSGMVDDIAHSFRIIGGYIREGNDGSWYEVNEAAAQALIDALNSADDFHPDVNTSGMNPALPFYEAVIALRNLSVGPQDVIFASPSLDSPQLSRTAADRDEANAIIEVLEAILKGKATETNYRAVSNLDALTYTLSFTGTSTQQFQVKDGKYLRSSDPKWGGWDDWYEVDPALVKALTDLFDPDVFERDYAPTLPESPIVTVFDDTPPNYIEVVKGDQSIYIYDTDWQADLKDAMLKMLFDTVSYDEASERTGGERYTLYFDGHQIEFDGAYYRVDKGFWVAGETVEMNSVPMELVCELLEDALSGETYHKTVRDTAKGLFDIEYDYTVSGIETALYSGTNNALLGNITDADTINTAVEQLDTLLQTIEGEGIPAEDLPAGKTVYSLSPYLNIQDGLDMVTSYTIEFREDGYLRYTGGDYHNIFNSDWYKIDASKAGALMTLVETYCKPLETLETIIKPNGVAPKLFHTLTYWHEAPYNMYNVFYGRNNVTNDGADAEAFGELTDLLCSIKLTRCDEVHDMKSGEEMLVYADADRHIFTFKDEHLYVTDKGCYRISRADADKLYDLLTDGQSIKASPDLFDRLLSKDFGVTIQTGDIVYDELGDEVADTLLDCLRALTPDDADRYALSAYSTDKTDHLLTFTIAGEPDNPLKLYLCGEYMKLFYNSGASRWYKLSTADSDRLYAEIEAITAQEDNEGLEDAMALFDTIEISSVKVEDQSDGGKEIYSSSNASEYTRIVDALKSLIALNGRKNYSSNPADKPIHETDCYRIILTGTPTTRVEGGPTELTYGFELYESKYLCYSTGSYGHFDGYSVWYDVDENAAQALNALIESVSNLPVQSVDDPFAKAIDLLTDHTITSVDADVYTIGTSDEVTHTDADTVSAIVSKVTSLAQTSRYPVEDLYLELFDVPEYTVTLNESEGARYSFELYGYDYLRFNDHNGGNTEYYAIDRALATELLTLVYPQGIPSPEFSYSSTIEERIDEYRSEISGNDRKITEVSVGTLTLLSKNWRTRTDEVGYSSLLNTLDSFLQTTFTPYDGDPNLLESSGIAYKISIEAHPHSDDPEADLPDVIYGYDFVLLDGKYISVGYRGGWYTFEEGAADTLITLLKRFG